MTAVDGADAALAERYGRGREPSRRTGAVLIGLALAAGIGWAAWVAWTGDDQVAWSDVGFRVDSAASTTVTFDVSMPPGTEAVCAVRALSQSFAVVGQRDVVIGPQRSRTTRHTAAIPTSERAVTGVVQDCTLRP